MNFYIDIDGNIREIDSELVSAWILAENPKADGLTLLPNKPSDNHQWNGHDWILPIEPVPSSVTARQIRLWLVTHGISLSSVDAAIATIPDDTTRQIVSIEWEYAPYVERSHPMLIPLAFALGMNESQVDQAFREAANL